MYRREAGAYYSTDILYAPVAGLETGFAEDNAVAVAEDSDGAEDESNDDFGARFTLVAGQQNSETTADGTASVWRCLKGLNDTCKLKTTIPASTSLGETGSIAASVAVSQRGEYVAVSGTALVSSVLYGTVSRRTGVPTACPLPRSPSYPGTLRSAGPHLQARRDRVDVRRGLLVVRLRHWRRLE